MLRQVADAIDPWQTFGSVFVPNMQDDGLFFGWKVMWAAFIVATFGWGVGFYGPPIFLHTIVSQRGWSLGTVSSAVTTHFLLGAFLVAQMPDLYRRFGVAVVTKASALATALGIFLWAMADQPWQLFMAALLSGAGWAGTGALAINMMVAPWFERRRPAALSTAYNGASVGGVIFSPLWIFLIDRFGFPIATMFTGGLMVLTLWYLSNRYFASAPADLGLRPDGDTDPERISAANETTANARAGVPHWSNRAFLTYVGGFTVGLFVQVGIIAHLVSLLIPAMGAIWAGIAASLATVCAVVGRTLAGWLMPTDADRRTVAAGTYVMQAFGCLLFVLAEGTSLPLLWAGIILFGLGIGNVTSLPPLIAQKEFAPADVARTIALGTAIGQAAYAFAPAAFGLIRIWSSPGSAAANPNVPAFFIVAAVLQILAAWIYMRGRR